MRVFTLLFLLILTPLCFAVDNSPPAMIPSPPPPAVALKLEEATRDLTMPSESDAPFQVVFFPSEAETLTPEEIAKLAGAPADSAVETRDLTEFFESCVTEEDWMNEDEKRVANRLAALRDLLQAELGDVQVVVWGDAQKQVAIIGKTEEHFAGLLTFVVET